MYVFLALMIVFSVIKLLVISIHVCYYHFLVYVFISIVHK